jgi:hypothetical protein
VQARLCHLVLSWGSIILKMRLSVVLLVMATSDFVAQRCDNCFTFHDINWKLVEFNGEPAKNFDDERETYLQLTIDENRLKGSGGCNRFIGSYELKGETHRLEKSALPGCSVPMPLNNAKHRSFALSGYEF